MTYVLMLFLIEIRFTRCDFIINIYPVGYTYFMNTKYMGERPKDVIGTRHFMRYGRRS